MTQSRPASPSGFILIIVMGMTMALSVLVIGFHRAARAHLEQANRMWMSQQSLNHAQTGLATSIGLIRVMGQEGQQKPGSKRPPRLVTERVLTFEEGSCHLELQPASSRININLFKDAQNQLNRSAVDQFLRLIDLINAELPADERLGYGLAAAIIDWTDKDDKPTRLSFVKGENRGVESGYYQSLDPPYACSNRPLETVGALRRVKGMNAAAFDRLQSYITVKGEGLINVNYAPPLVLQTFGPEFDPSVVNLITARRSIKPFERLSDIEALPGISGAQYQALRRYGTVKHSDDYFHVRVQANIGPVQRVLRALIRRNKVTQNVDVIRYEEVH